MNKLFAGALGAALLTSCSSWPSHSPLSERASLQIQPRIVTGGYAVQADIRPYTPADVDHLVVQLYTVDSSSVEHQVQASNSIPVQKIIPSAELSQGFGFSRLKMNTLYRIKAIAYDAATNSISPACHVDVIVERNDTPTVGTLLVTLSDKAFDGQGSSSITFATGSVLNSTNSESIE